MNLMLKNRPSIGISHPDKALWPATADSGPVTKLDLAHYYLAAAGRILPHVAGRPISVVRAPDGIQGQHFFQRHVMKGFRHARPITVEGEDQPYLSIDDVEGLLELAQVAVLEIHPWGSRKGDPDTPERIIFDLDPAPDVAFAQVMAAAREIRERLTACGLRPFLKTTGGKGLHVVTAVKGTPRHPIGWPEAKLFSRQVCAMMAADSPDRYVSTMSKKQRGGRIFLDYLRNDRTATAVAPWSARARQGAPVALPVEWTRLRAGFNPGQFNLASAPRFLEQPDAWKDLASSAGSLPVALKKLAG